ncbi:MAG TPA: FtsW/RodA/SpoVE family cell cycle protein, partial [Kiloniellales bacterium]
MALSRLSFERNPQISLAEKFGQINWGMVFVISLIAVIGCAMLYSAAEGSLDPWASRQAVRFGAGLLAMFAVTLIDVRFWFRHAYVIYFGAVALLGAVEFVGTAGMGAQRWIDLKI